MTANGKSVFLSAADRQLLGELAREGGYVSEPIIDLVEKLVNAELAVFGMGRRHGIFERIRLLLEETVRVAKPEIR